MYRLIAGEAARLVGAGTVLGIGGSLAAATFIRGLFYGVRTWDAPTLTIVVVVLILAALPTTFQRVVLTRSTRYKRCGPNSDAAAANRLLTRGR